MTIYFTDNTQIKIDIPESVDKSTYSDLIAKTLNVDNCLHIITGEKDYIFNVSKIKYIEL